MIFPKHKCTTERGMWYLFLNEYNVLKKRAVVTPPFLVIRFLGVDKMRQPRLPYTEKNPTAMIPIKFRHPQKFDDYQ